MRPEGESFQVLLDRLAESQMLSGEAGDGIQALARAMKHRTAHLDAFRVIESNDAELRIAYRSQAKPELTGSWSRDFNSRVRKLAQSFVLSDAKAHMEARVVSYDTGKTLISASLAHVPRIKKMLAGEARRDVEGTLAHTDYLWVATPGSEGNVSSHVIQNYVPSREQEALLNYSAFPPMMTPQMRFDSVKSRLQTVAAFYVPSPELAFASAQIDNLEALDWPQVKGADESEWRARDAAGNTYEIMIYEAEEARFSLSPEPHFACSLSVTRPEAIGPVRTVVQIDRDVAGFAKYQSEEADPEMRLGEAVVVRRAELLPDKAELAVLARERDTFSDNQLPSLRWQEGVSPFDVGR